MRDLGAEVEIERNSQLQESSEGTKDMIEVKRWDPHKKNVQEERSRFLCEQKNKDH